MNHPKSTTTSDDAPDPSRTQVRSSATCRALPDPTKPVSKAESPDWFNELADSSLVRVQQIVATPKNPKPLINVSASTWWRLVRSRKAPRAVRVSAGVTAWRVGDLRCWLRSL
jgi:predicted DNA-binding transcriptional regulator AlpA